MPINPALTSPEIAALAQTNQIVPAVLSFEPDTVIGTATVAMSPNSLPITHIDISGASGGWTNQRQGQLVKITDSAGATLRGFYRNRLVGDTANLWIDEITFSDPGIVAIDTRTSIIQVGDIVSIIERYPLFAVKPYQDASGVIYQDFSIPVGINNVLPDDASYNVTINGQPGDFVTQVAQGGTQALAIVLTVTPWPTSVGTVYTYTWTFPASFTGISGGTTATPSATAPVGSFHIYCKIADSIAMSSFTISRWVRIHDPSDPPLAVIITADPRDRSYRHPTIRMIQASISTIPLLAKCVLWSYPAATWGGSSVSTATVKHVGFLWQQPYMTEPGYYESSGDIIGTAGMLDMLAGYAASLTYNVSPATWNQITPQLATVQFMMWWLLRWHVANFLQCFNFTPLNTSSTTGRRNVFSVADGQSALTQLNKSAATYDANVGSRSDGEIVVAPIPSLLVNQTGVVKRATLTNATYSDLQVTYNRATIVGLVTWKGFQYSLGQDLAITATAPSEKSAQGGKTQTATDKVFEGIGDAAGRVGQAFSLANVTLISVTFNIPLNWDVFEPADMELIDVAIPAAKSPTGVQQTLTVVPISVTKKWIPGRRAMLQVKAEGLTAGVQGLASYDPVTQPNAVGSNSNPISSPVPPAPPTWGSESSAVPNTSSGLIGATLDGHFWRGTTPWTDGSPTSDQTAGIGNVIKLLADNWYYPRLIMFGSQGALLTDNATVTAPTWKTVALNSAVGATFTQHFNLRTSAGIFSIKSNGISSPSYIPGVGFKITSTGSTAGTNILDVIATFPSGITGATLRIVGSRSAATGAVDNLIGLASDGSSAESYPEPSGSGAIDFSHAFTSTIYGAEGGMSAGATAGDTGIVTDFYVSGDGANPFGGSGGGSANITYIGDMVGSINRKGWFAWLSTDGSNVFVSTTTNYFQSVATNAQVGAYDAAKTYGFGVDSYNNGASATGYGYVTAGSAVYETNNWFASVSSTGVSLSSHGGAITAPYSKVSGAANAANPPQFFVVKGVSTNLQGLALDGGTSTVISGSTKYPYSTQAVNSFTLSGSYISVLMQSGDIALSSDGGDTFSAGTPLPGASGYFLNGSPVNSSIFIAGGSQSLALGTDHGSSWIDLYSGSGGYASFASATYGTNAGLVIVTAMLDLSLAYQNGAVTQ